MAFGLMHTLECESIVHSLSGSSQSVGLQGRGVRLEVLLTTLRDLCIFGTNCIVSRISRSREEVRCSFQVDLRKCCEEPEVLRFV